MSELFLREAETLMQTYGRTPIVFVRGEGSWLYDETGVRYLDCLTGLAVVSVGHSNARVATAAAAQLNTLVHVSNLFYTRPMVELAGRLTELSGLGRAFFANCGATANEAAIKLARRWGQLNRGADCVEIVSLLDSFHGRTLATLAATGQPTKQALFEPLPPGFRQVAPADVAEIERTLTPQTAAVMVETTQGEGGVVPLAAEYLRAVRDLCDERGVLLIVDDVQAGVGRTGSWFSWQQLGFEPDIATTAKALANGLPIGVCLASESVSKAFQPGDHATTFGGGPVVCAAALAVLDEIEELGLLANCLERSAQIRSVLSTIAGVVEVRGRGLLLGVVLDREHASKVTAAALEHGLIVNAVRPDTIRLAPPLSISADEVDELASRLAKAMEQV